MIQEINPVEFALKEKSAHDVFDDSSFFGNVSIYGWVFFGLLIVVVILGYWSLYKAGRKKKIPKDFENHSGNSQNKL